MSTDADSGGDTDDRGATGGETATGERGADPGADTATGEGVNRAGTSDREPAIVARDGETGDRTPLRPARPLEPEAVDAENAAFVLLGVVLVAGLLVGAAAGL